MKYEFETLTQIVHGNLNPSNKSANNTASHIAYLKQFNDKLVLHYHALFQKGTGNQYTLLKLDYYAFDCIYPIAHLDPLLTENDSQILESLKDEFIKVSGIQPQRIANAGVCKTEVHYLLSVRIEAEFNVLSPLEIRHWYYAMLLHQETFKIKSSFQDHVFSLKSEKKIQLYVQNHQYHLKTLAGIVLEWIPTEERKQMYTFTLNYSLLDVYKTIYKYLELLLTHIEKHFVKYLDLNAQVSYHSKVIALKELKEKALFVTGRLQNASLSQPLRTILEKPLQKPSTIEKTDNFSYHDLLYYKKFFLEFYRVLSKKEEPVSDQLIIELLHNVNYNALKFLKFLINRIQEKLETIGSLHEKIEVLLVYLKEYHQSHCKINIPCYGNISLKDHMIRWLDEEIDYYSKLLEHSLQKQAQSTDTKNRNYTLRTSGALFFKITG